MVRYCSNCGTESNDDSIFCRTCGKRFSGLHYMDRDSNEKKDKNLEKILILVVAVLIIAIAIVGTFAFISLNNNDNTGIMTNDGTNGGNLGTDNLATVTSSSIPLSEVYGLAVALDTKAQTQDLSVISSVQYKGVTFTKQQCLYIFAKAIDMKSRGVDGNVAFGSFATPNSPLNSYNANYITKSEYVDMAQRTFKWMDSHGRAPNYTGIVVPGSPDVGYNYLVALFALVIIDSKDGSLVPYLNF